MKNRMKFTAIIYLSVMVLMNACTPQEDVPGTGNGTMGLSFKIQSSGATAANARVMGEHLLFTDGFIQIKELEMELEGINENGEFNKEYEVEFDEIKKVNLDRFNDDADFFINIPEGEYEEIEMEIDLIDYEEEPSILLNGIFTESTGKEIPFRFELFGDEIDFGVEINADDENYFVVDPINNPLVLFELVPERWFSSISMLELENAMRSDDGVIVFSEESNQSLFTKIGDKIKIDAEIEIELLD
ncbi:MAG: hypothetical protein WD398_03975 [Cyclobacteriaceae bacterium]